MKLSDLVVVFDLDHTLILTDDYRDLWAESVQEQGFDGIAAGENWDQSLGLPLTQQALKLGMDEDQADAAIEVFWETAASVSPRAMPGAGDVLDKLSAEGVRMYLSTGSSPKAAARWLNHFGWEHYFQMILGSERGADKGADHYSEIIADSGFSETDIRARMITIGDGQYDMIFGKNHGLEWTVGFASDAANVAEHTAKLKAAGAKIIIEDLDDVHAVLATVVRRGNS